MHTVAAALLLTARFYTIADVPVGDRVAATRVTANILRAAGIEILWMNCDDRVSAHQRVTRKECMTPPNPDEVIVRFVSAQLSTDRLNGPGAERMGDAYVDKVAASGTLATVYVDRVAAMARSAGLDAGTLLGRVMAHEIGHLLLGTASHRPSGLMRAEWSTTLLQRRIANDWRFSTLDAASAREGVLKRVRAVQPTRTAESSPVTVLPRSAHGRCSSDMSDVPYLPDVPTSRSGALSPARRAKPLTARSNRGSRTRPSF